MQRMWTPGHMRKLTQAERDAVERGAEMYPSSLNEQPPEPWPTKPTTTRECDAIVHHGEDGKEIGMGEPGFACPFLSCKWHNAIGYNQSTGSYSIDAKHAFGEDDPVPDVFVDDSAHSCARKAADNGPQLLETIGKSMHITRERARQIVDAAVDRVRNKTPKKHLRVLADYADVEMAVPAESQRVPSRGDVWLSIEGSGFTVIVENGASDFVEYVGPKGRVELMRTMKFVDVFTFIKSRASGSETTERKISAA